jgi:hypothetical protein
MPYLRSKLEVFEFSSKRIWNAIVVFWDVRCLNFERRRIFSNVCSHWHNQPINDYQVMSLVCHIGYLFGKTKYISVNLYLAGVDLIFFSVIEMSSILSNFPCRPCASPPDHCRTRNFGFRWGSLVLDV